MYTLAEDNLAGQLTEWVAWVLKLPRLFSLKYIYNIM